MYRVETSPEAERTGFQGSPGILPPGILPPSILIDGVDVFAEPDAEVGLACRRYRTPDGFETDRARGHLARTEH